MIEPRVDTFLPNSFCLVSCKSWACKSLACSVMAASDPRLKSPILRSCIAVLATIKDTIQSILSETGRIDVLVNNAGYVLSRAFEDLAMDEIKAEYETNVFGLIRTTQAVLPIMREQKSGIIVNISSGNGRIGFPVASAYVSTKFAVEGLSESMSYELEPFGIKVVLVE